MENVESVSPLSPTQEAMLVATLAAPGSGVLVLHTGWTIAGRFDPAAFRRAWQALLQRHTVLRTGFFWEGLERPLQVVRQEVELPWEDHDWSDADPAAHERRLAEWIDADRRRGFDLTQAPLLRIAHFVLGEGPAGGKPQSRFVWSHHHLLFDGWSVPLLLGEVFALYEAEVSGTPLRLPPARPYAEYLAWLASRDGAAGEAFWRERLAGYRVPTPVALPAVEPPTPEADPYRLHTLTLDPPATAALQQLARERRVTLNTLVLGVLGLLLAHRTGDDDVVLGNVVSGRPAELADAERRVGLFLNTVPVRMTVDLDAPVDAGSDAPGGGWLEGLQRRQNAAREHEHVPLARIHELSEVPRGRPLFELLVIFENLPGAELQAQLERRYEIRDTRRTEDRTGYPLAVTVVPGDRLELQFTARAEALDGASLAAFASQLEGLLRALPGARGPLGDLPWCPAADLARIAAHHQGPPAAGDEPPERALARVAATQPEAVAVLAPAADGSLDGAVAWTYQRLDHTANHLAARLRELGAGPEARVGLLAARTPAAIAALFGTLKAGAAYLPLDLSFPAERLAETLRDAGVKIVFADAAGRAVVQALGGGPELTILALEEEAAGTRSRPPAVGVAPQNAAYVIYTSGSTGRPKGVVVPRSALAQHTASAREAYGLGPGDRVLQLASFAFDASAEEIYPCLAAGATLVLRTPTVLDSGRGFTAGLAAWGVTVVDLPTAFWHEWVPTVGPAAPLPAGLRLVILGGEEARADRLAAWQQVAGGVVTFNTYGPTEATIVATRWPAPAPSASTSSTREPFAAPAAIPIGLPISGARVMVADRRLQPVAVGVEGELLLGGAGLARGYLDRPALTAERFVPDPAAGTAGVPAGARLYRSGDRVAWRPDGQLLFRGRTDGQVKVRGFRVEVGEVEARLRQHPAVGDVAVVPRPDPAGGARLVAFVVPAPGGPSAAFSELRQHLAAQLPAAMVPAAWVELAELPRTTAGKIHRQELAAREATSPAAAPRSTHRVPPRDATEQGLAAIWRELLEAPELGVEDDVFEWGAHSLLITQVIARCRDHFGVELPLELFFQAPTLAAQALEVDRRRDAAEALELPPIERVPRDGEIPLSYPQERLWFLAQLDPDSGSYHVPRSLRLRGALDREALRRAYEGLIERHEVFRTTFPAVDGRPRQQVHPPRSFALPRVDLTRLGPAVQEALLRRWIDLEGRRTFDLSHGPLLRAMLWTLAADHHVVYQTEHHLVHDGWAEGVLLGDLLALYRAACAGEPSPLPPLPVQFADFAAWQRRWVAGALLERQLDYWRRELAGAPELLVLPSDRPRPAVQRPLGNSRNLYLTPEQAAALERLGRHHGATYFMTLLAVFQVWLYRLTGEEDLVIGTGVANRQRREVEGLIGMVINTLALRTRLDGAPSFAELAGRVRRVCLGAFQHQDLPFQKVVEALAPPRTLSYAPLFQVLFAFYDAPAPVIELPGLTVESIEAGNRSAKFDFVWVVTPSIPVADPRDPRGTVGATRVHFEWSSDLFDESTIERYWDLFVRLVDETAAHPERPISAFGALTAAERQEVLEAWNAPARRGAPEAPIHLQVAAQAARTPDALALDFADAVLTYRELVEQASALAAELQRAGVRRGDAVAILAEPTAATVVRQLAVLQAGGFYVPLDLDDPADRRAFQLEDSGARLVLGPQGLPSPSAVHSGVHSRVQCEVHSEDLAYLMYTSGSTGRPKGAAVPHRAISRLAADDTLADLGPGDRVAQIARLSFDAATFEVWSALTRGATVVGIDRDTALDPDRFAAALADRAITAMFLTVALFNQVAAHRPEAFGGVRHLLVGGEALVPEPIRQVLASPTPPRRLVNGYGPTENTTFTTWHEVREVPPGATSVPLGRGLTGTSVFVVDALGQPVPPGVAGELWTGGAGLAHGYWNRPRETAAAFVPDGLSGAAGASGARLYRTGDLARWRRADPAVGGAVLEYLGRIDQQVKIRGFRVEPGEVAAVLSDHPAVAEAAVVVRGEKGSPDRFLAAFVVPREGCEADPAALRAALRERLPEFLVPAVIQVLEALPRGATGKVDLRALALWPLGPREGDAAPGVEWTAPRTDAERAVVAIFAEVLGRAPGALSVHDSFFDLGGHSLLATQVLSRLREREGVNLPIRALFEAPTVAALAGLAEGVERERGAGEGVRAIPTLARAAADLDTLWADLGLDRPQPQPEPGDGEGRPR